VTSFGSPLPSPTSDSADRIRPAWSAIHGDAEKDAFGGN
jgi:hypothetical protein